MKYEKNIPDSKEVPVLYKYRGFNDRAIESVLESTLWFSPPSTFNDPFDCSLDIKEDLSIDEKTELHAKISLSLDKYTNEQIIKNTIAYRTIPDYRQDMDRRLRKTMVEGARSHGVFCFSQSNIVSLMWSHYADSHKGFCIGYERTEKNQLGDNEYTRPVNYNGAPYILLSEIFDDNGLISKQTTDLFMYTKDPNWEYEKEWRILSENVGAEKADELGTKIVSICFGLKMPEWQKKSIAGLLKSTTIELYQMYRTPESFDLYERPYNLGS